MIRKVVAALALLGVSPLGASLGVSSSAWAKPHDASMEKYAAAIRKIESTGRYHITANAGGGRTALGAYQILDTNLASWSRAALGRPVDQHEFLRSPHLQDRVFHHRFGHYVRKYKRPRRCPRLAGRRRRRPRRPGRRGPLRQHALLLRLQVHPRGQPLRRRGQTLRPGEGRG
jgi:hypothetical protein